MTWSARPAVADSFDHDERIDLLQLTTGMAVKQAGDQGRAGWHLDLVTMRTIVGKI